MTEELYQLMIKQRKKKNVDYNAEVITPIVLSVKQQQIWYEANETELLQT